MIPGTALRAPQGGGLPELEWGTAFSLRLNKALESNRYGFCHILAEGPWASDFTFLCLSFPFCEMASVVPASQCCGEMTWSPLESAWLRAWHTVGPQGTSVPDSSLASREPEQSQGIPGPGRAGRDNLADSDQLGDGGASDSTKSRN